MNAPASSADSEQPIVQISSRVAAIFFLLATAAASACRFLPQDTALMAALKVVVPTLALGIAPGALVTMLWGARRQFTTLEIVGFGIALSFGLIQLLTIVAISAHLSPEVMMTILGLVAVLMALRLIWTSGPAVTVTVDELIVLVLVLLLGVPLYIQGSPISSYEDQVLVAIVRRLSQLDYPRLDNFYVAPDIVYTYPFPGVHYFMSLVARIGDVDPLFVYHKLRFFWGPAALVMLYLVARAVFGYAAVACAVTVTAIVLVCAGAFAMVPGFSSYWAQLVPFSYVPDVAMTMLLPALLVSAFSYLQSPSTREHAFFFSATAVLLTMLTIVHIREIVQFAAYVGCFLVVAALVRNFRPYLRRAAVLLVLTVGLAAAFSSWQARIVPIAAEVVDKERAGLLAVASVNSVRTLLFAPAPTLLNDYVQYFGTMFDGLMPFLLFAGPAVVVFFRTRPLVWLVSSSTLAYLAVISIPLLAIPYIYLTYFEILHIPVRNVIFFAYTFAGALIYVAVVWLTSIDRTRLSVPIAGAAAGVVALLATLCLNQSHRGFLAPLAAAFGLTFVLAWGAPTARRVGVRVFAAALFIVLGLVALFPERQPAQRRTEVSVRWTPGLPDTERAAFERQFSLADGEPSSNYSDTVNVWNYSLNDLSPGNIKALVHHPQAIDTNQIDRTRFTVALQPPRSDHPYLGVQHVTWLQYPGTIAMIATAFLMWTLGFALPAVLASDSGNRTVTALSGALTQPFYRRALAYALFVIPFALWSARPTLSPLTMSPMPPAGRADTPKAMFLQIPCVTTPRMTARFTEHMFPGNDIILPEAEACAPDFGVIQWVQTHLPTDAVFAVDRWNPYPAPVFMPQQVVVFPTLDASFIHEDDLFRGYYRFFDQRMRKYRVQPFFNAVENPGERAEFVEALGVTHVLVNPAHYDEMRSALDTLPDRFALKYADGKWAVYEVTRKLG